MRNLLLATTAILALGAASPVLAQSSSGEAAFGGGAGAAAGATAGFFLGGPIGAVIGGFTGAALGASATVPDTTVTYVSTHPVQPVYISGPIDIGARVGPDIRVYAVPSDPDYGYFYANDRAYIVDLASSEIVQSPGYVVPRRAVEYAQANPTTTITINAQPAPGYQLGPDVKLGRVPDSALEYVYINDQPALVDRYTRTIVWIGE